MTVVVHMTGPQLRHRRFYDGCRVYDDQSFEDPSSGGDGKGRVCAFHEAFMKWHFDPDYARRFGVQVLGGPGLSWLAIRTY